ncbi:DUF7344 domain-containing protein [Halorientalis litorea]|jgi:hypothetical protein|uniref:DUF7344 domain-containing protein n=1 Tax=Halorientalis litorea TaxID=2931977 RepID=UPI001FF685BE|nr:hypothetical protein [Halorientalis litorea]
MSRGPPQRGTASSLADILSAVADERRRAVLDVLDRTDEEAIPFDTLSDRVVELVSDGDDEPGADHRQRVHATLHHTHLPKLAASGLVVYDTDAMTVTRVDSPRERQLRTLLESYERSE